MEQQANEAHQGNQVVTATQVLLVEQHPAHFPESSCGTCSLGTPGAFLAPPESLPQRTQSGSPTGERKEGARFQYTKPLTFADCISDELPLGWEEAYDPQVGVYYIDHNTKTTQIEDPRVQWRREQEHMLKDYLVLAQEAIAAQKEIYQVKQQRLELAQQEYRQLHDVWEHKLGSQTSLLSGSSSSSKYDPEILKAEIATTKSRVNKLKREVAHMKQELQYKEHGFQTLKKIDMKMSDTQGGYKLDEAQAILSEMKAIKKAITSGEKEKQDLIQSLARLKDSFVNDRGSQSDLWASSVSLESSSPLLPRQYLDVSSQTDVSGNFISSSNNQLAEKVRLRLRYEEAKR
ncbi:PREDICTED: protein KIBRA-like, partial [Tinamus guttatus]|uniref:protein KIBRA-like n=1 Tax=Tinamus guttatus TaxID=94827 RepID=UPI00052F1800